MSGFGAPAALSGRPSARELLPARQGGKRPGLRNRIGRVVIAGWFGRDADGRDAKPVSKGFVVVEREAPAEFVLSGVDLDVVTLAPTGDPLDALPPPKLTAPLGAPFVAWPQHRIWPMPAALAPVVPSTSTVVAPTPTPSATTTAPTVRAAVLAVVPSPTASAFPPAPSPLDFPRMPELRLLPSPPLAPPLCLEPTLGVPPAWTVLAARLHLGSALETLQAAFPIARMKAPLAALIRRAAPPPTPAAWPRPSPAPRLPPDMGYFGAHVARAITVGSMVYALAPGRTGVAFLAVVDASSAVLYGVYGALFLLPPLGPRSLDFPWADVRRFAVALACTALAASILAVCAHGPSEALPAHMVVWGVEAARPALGAAKSYCLFAAHVLTYGLASTLGGHLAAVGGAVSRWSHGPGECVRSSVALAAAVAPILLLEVAVRLAFGSYVGPMTDLAVERWPDEPLLSSIVMQGSLIPTVALHWVDTWLAFCVAAAFPLWTFAVIALVLRGALGPAVCLVLTLLARARWLAI